jgi:hypothetical protein
MRTLARMRRRPVRRRPPLTVAVLVAELPQDLRTPVAAGLL